MEKQQPKTDRGNQKFVITGLRLIRQKHASLPALQEIYTRPKLQDNVSRLQKQLDYIIVNKANLSRLQNKKIRDMERKKQQQLIKQVDNLQNTLKQLQIAKQPQNRKRNRYPRNINSHNFYILPSSFQKCAYKNSIFNSNLSQIYNHDYCKYFNGNCYHICHNYCHDCFESNYKNRKMKENKNEKQNTLNRIQLLNPLNRVKKSSINILSESTIKRQNIRRKMKKYFNAVYFIQVLKSFTKNFSKFRIRQIKQFYQKRFNKQINNLKQWLLESHQFIFQIILQKQQLNFQFSKQKRKKVKIQKQNLVLQLILRGLKEMLQKCSIIKIETFSELLYQLCSRGSFPKNQFWSAYEINHMCISQRYGCMRLDQNLQIYFICILVFMKMLFFNMLLQPHKFDDQAFPKNKQPLTTNLKVLVSVYYYIIKCLLEQYLQEQRDKQIYNEGNWLKVDKQFVVTCSQPLVFGQGYPEYDEYISGLYQFDNFKYLCQFKVWKNCKHLIKKILKELHFNMKEKGKTLKRKHKFKFALEK